MDDYFRASLSERSGARSSVKVAECLALTEIHLLGQSAIHAESPGWNTVTNEDGKGLIRSSGQVREEGLAPETEEAFN